MLDLRPSRSITCFITSGSPVPASNMPHFVLGGAEASWRWPKGCRTRPLYHRRGALSAAFRNLDAHAKDDLTRRYAELCAHYRMTRRPATTRASPTRTARSRPAWPPQERDPRARPGSWLGLLPHPRAQARFGRPSAVCTFPVSDGDRTFSLQQGKNGRGGNTSILSENLDERTGSGARRSSLIRAATASSSTSPDRTASILRGA